MPTTTGFVMPKYDYWARVLLIPCERVAARVVDIHSHHGWTEYDVRYFDSGEAKTTRVHEDELEAMPDAVMQSGDTTSSAPGAGVILYDERVDGQ